MCGSLPSWIIPHKSHKFEQKNRKTMKSLTFSVVPVVLANIRSFKFVIG